MLLCVDVDVEAGQVAEDLVDQRGRRSSAAARASVGARGGEGDDDGAVDAGATAVDVRGDGRQRDVLDVEPVAHQAVGPADAEDGRAAGVRLRGASQGQLEDPPEGGGRGAYELAAHGSARELGRVD